MHVQEQKKLCRRDIPLSFHLVYNRLKEKCFLLLEYSKAFVTHSDTFSLNKGE